MSAATDAGALAGVEATLTGPTIEVMKCEPRGTATMCIWPTEPVFTGSYSLEVNAPGFLPTNIGAMITVGPDPNCGCTQATIQPTEITLERL